MKRPSEIIVDRLEPRTAVALRYDGTNAPRVTAQGHGILAEEIIAIARAHGVFLHEDEQLARLLAQVELGTQIPETLYIAVARVIAFAYFIAGKFPATAASSQAQETV